jgi:hypothetical protein
MQRCIELAGFVAAQVVCCLFDGQPFVPLGFTQRGEGEKIATVLSAGSPEFIKAFSQRWLDVNAACADDAVVATDGYVTLPPAARSDAILLDLRSYGSPPRKMRMVIPYRPHGQSGGFAVHRPKFVVEELAGQDQAALTTAFFRGVFSHEPGSRIWQACIDPRW